MIIAIEKPQKPKVRRRQKRSKEGSHGDAMGGAEEIFEGRQRDSLAYLTGGVARNKDIGAIRVIEEFEDNRVARLDRNKGSLETRTQQIKAMVKNQIDSGQCPSELPIEAGRLLFIHNKPENIPTETLNDSNFDDARLLAACEILYDRQQTNN